MDLTQDVTYRGVSLNDATPQVGKPGLIGCSIEFVDMSPVQVVQYADKRAQTNGVDYQGVGNLLLGGRTVTLRGTLYGETRGDLWDRLERLRDALNPVEAFEVNEFSLGYWPLTWTEPESLERHLLVRPGGVREAIDRDRQGTNAKIASKRDSVAQSLLWECAFTSRDPRVYGAVKTADLTASGGGDEVLDSGALSFPGDDGSPDYITDGNYVSDPFAMLIGQSLTVVVSGIEDGTSIYAVNTAGDFFFLGDGPGTYTEENTTADASDWRIEYYSGGSYDGGATGSGTWTVTAPGGGGSASGTITNDGDYPSLLFIELVLDDNPGTVVVVWNDITMTIPVDAGSSGRIVRYRPIERILTLEDPDLSDFEILRMDMLQFGDVNSDTQHPVVLPGDNTYDVSASGGVTILDGSILTFKDAYA